MLYDKNMIWIDGMDEPDAYAEFIGSFSAPSQSKIQLKLACDGLFAAYVNGHLAAFGAAADYPWHKLYHKKDITKYCDVENEIRIEVWHQGVDSQTYIKNAAGCYFVIEQEGSTLLESDSRILSRRNIKYKNGYCKKITSQMGLSFSYDNTIENDEPYRPSVERNAYTHIYQRKTGEIKLGGRAACQCTECEGGYLIDFGEEVVGFLELDFCSPNEQDLVITYGEHLVDGRVPQCIEGRDFSVEFRAKSGENRYLNPFLRLAGRYLQVFCDAPLDITYIGLRPTDRKVAEKKRRFDDELTQKIYDISVNTLKKCMHEHYEDCPWREQAMYVLDSRNQMLCGYYAFSGFYYQRENILFIAEGQREDGLLSLCFPAGIDIPIPFFSLTYLMMVHDYVKHTADRSLLSKLKLVIDRILDAFEARIDHTGLIPNFPYPCWNFYEWSEASDNGLELGRKKEDPYHPQYDLILNCMYVVVCGVYKELYGEERGGQDMLPAIHATFYHPEKELYCLSTKGEHYSQLGNSMALLAGLGDAKLADRIVNDSSLIPITLSMNTFYYDALLQTDETYQKFVAEDIRRKYGNMVAQGATTFWETEEGWTAFGGAGSLCHGWSAIPAYYLPLLYK